MIEMVIPEPKMKPCPFCNMVQLAVARVTFKTGVDDEGYRPVCNCGWAGRQIHKWYSNRVKLIDDWNSKIIEGEFTEM